MSASTLLFAFLGGFLPALLWLWFWLKEDRLHPEPRGAIILTFFGGMAAALLAYFTERSIIGMGLAFSVTLILWAIVEEVFKFGFAYFTALRRKVCDEPVDDMIYMLTAALGFAALENTLFLIAPLANGDIAKSLLTGNLRFIGATLLHIAASSLIGAFGAFYFYKGRKTRDIAIVIGLVVATALHAGFNLIINSQTNRSLITAFAIAWATIIVVLVVFEKVKKIGTR
ncbi:MAG: hypothetical protein G01um101417_253 [Parcubacteria group bacterium Gr01-1014_17]|nr:MAG: hypothetical protein G01um101417_253 [Parcubacteria group bacterium Gr01-1014_17]